MWARGRTPINVTRLQELLLEYSKKANAAFLSDGFQFGFKLNFEGQRIPLECHNPKSVQDNPGLAKEKIMQRVKLGRIAGPFSTKPIFFMRCSSIGLVPKKMGGGGFRLITHPSYPPGLRVYEHIDDIYASVRYTSFDNAVNMIKHFAKAV